MPMTAFYDANGALLRVSPGALVGADLTNVLHDLYGVAG